MRDRLSKEIVTEILQSFYRHNFIVKPKRAPFSDLAIRSGATLHGVEAPGLGDSLILTSVLPHVKINSESLRPLISTGHLDETDFVSAECISSLEVADFDWGGGHCTQRLQRALGTEASLVPGGKIRLSHKAKERGRVFVHLTTSTDWKRIVLNSLDEISISTVNSFFKSNPSLTPIYCENNLSLAEMVGEMESCEFFLGIDSGPMHLAAALKIKSIIIINDLAGRIHLPCLRECRVPNTEWLYPQNVHLNMSGENQLVPRLNFKNLASAFLGKVYPYWSEEYLDITIN